MALLENEAGKSENTTTMTSFIVIFVIAAISAAMCCYFNYTFETELARAVFIMFVGAFFGEMLIFRNLLILILSLIKYCKGKCDGYEYIEFKNKKEVNDMLRLAIASMFHHHKTPSKDTPGETPGNDDLPGPTEQPLAGKTPGETLP